MVRGCSNQISVGRDGSKNEGMDISRREPGLRRMDVVLVPWIL